jgi:nucleotide-binding universal stress UspA family protein
MKFKKGSNGGVAVELGPEETRFTVLQGPLPAFRLKKIMVPVDFSECSNKAIQYAVPFAKQFGAEVVLLHLVEPYPQVPEMAPIDIENLQDAKKQMEACRRASCSISVKTLVRVGEATTGIIEAAKELDIDLIILSTHGRTGVARVFLGSTAERVVRLAPCPVLVVRERERDFVAEANDK